MKKALLLLLLVLLPGFSWAQACSGVNVGGGQCVPPDVLYGNASDSNTSQPTVYNRFAAISMDMDTGGLGYVVGQYSERAAKKDVINACKSRGGRNCEVILAFHDECGAVAQGQRTLGKAAVGQTLREAEDAAIGACSEDGDQCQVSYSACSVPY